jgi:hypothetical protein
VLPSATFATDFIDLAKGSTPADDRSFVTALRRVKTEVGRTVQIADQCQAFAVAFSASILLL